MRGSMNHQYASNVWMNYKGEFVLRSRSTEGPEIDTTEFVKKSKQKHQTLGVKENNNTRHRLTT